MSQPQVLNTLHEKRKDIEAYIASLERDLEGARRDLSAVLATITVFSAQGAKVTAYMNLTRLFPRHELPRLCRAALEATTEPITTREIAAYVIKQKGLDGSDRHLRKAMAYKVVQIMRRWELERKACRVGKKAGAVVWHGSVF